MAEKKAWFQNDAFWLQFAPIMFDTQRWAEAPAVAEAVLKIIGAPSTLSPTIEERAARILDAGCGPGRIAIELALRGAKVTGVDLVRSFLIAAGDSAADEDVEIELVEADLRKFTRPESFDAAINLYTSFGYCDSIEEDMQILKNLAASLRPGGWLILEMTGREIAARDFTEGEWFERSGFTVLTEFSVVGAWEALRSRWILIDGEGRRVEHSYDQRLYSAVELKRLVTASGFSSAEVYGDFDFSPYNEKAHTMVVIGRK